MIIDKPERYAMPSTIKTGRNTGRKKLNTIPHAMAAQNNDDKIKHKPCATHDIPGGFAKMIMRKSTRVDF